MKARRLMFGILNYPFPLKMNHIVIDNYYYSFIPLLINNFMVELPFV